MYFLKRLSLLFPLTLLFFTGAIGAFQIPLFSFESYDIYTVRPHNWENLHVYTWDEEGWNNAGWPGIQLTSPCEDGWYRYTVKRPVDGIIFTAGTEGPQTDDLMRDKEGWYSIQTNTWYDNTPPTRKKIDEPETAKQPVIEHDTVTLYFSHPASEVYIAGDFSDWDTHLMERKDDDDTLWQYTTDMPEESFAYAFAVPEENNEKKQWYVDPGNPEKVPGPYGYDSLIRQVEFSTELPSHLSIGETHELKAYYNGNRVDAEWSIKPSTEGVSVENGEFLAKEDYLSELDGKTLQLTAEYEGRKTSQEVTLKEELYRYTINYYRYDENYTNWNLWIWVDGEDGAEYPFNRGKVEGFHQAEHTFASPEINVIPRRGHWQDQEVARQISVEEDNEVEVWLIQDIEEVYYSMEEAKTNPRIFAALLDARDTLNAALSRQVQEEELDTFRLIEKEEGTSIPITATAHPEGDDRVKIHIDEPDKIDVRKVYILESEDFIGTEVTMRNVLDDQRFYHEDWLGYRYSSDGTTFRVWAPTAEEVKLATYEEVTPDEYDRHGDIPDHTNYDELYDMERLENGVWETTVREDLHGRYYMFEVHFADGTTNYAKDPYARAVAPNGQRSAVVDLSLTNPENWENYERPRTEKWTSAVIYELHVRDFSMDKESGISKDNRGKYLAFTEEGTRGPGGVKTGIDHLKELGITHLHLLPVYDFRSVNELTVDDPDCDDPVFNWGYDPHNYNVPEGSYASDVWDPTTRIIEFKKMVKSLQEAGIEVIMDVVYNHTYEIEDGPFDSLVPGYYYRTDERGRFTNGSGCGNEVASERPMVRKYIIDSVRYWAEEYNIDGFRFDLMALIDISTMEKLAQVLHDEICEHMLIYGEPWAAAETPLPGDEMTLKGAQRGKNFAVFNDHFRNTIKGGSDDQSRGFATCEHDNEDPLITGIMGALDDFADKPTETINYVTCHDNLTLWDKVIRTRHQEEQEGFINIYEGRLTGEDAEKFDSIEEAVKENSNPYHELHDLENPEDIMKNETVRRANLCNGIVLTSQGIPFLHAGVETLRTKFGDHNSYRSPDVINMLRWERKEKFMPVFEYYRGLIELRRNHPAFQMDCEELIEDHLEFEEAEDKVVAYYITDNPLNEPWDNILVIYNANHHDVDYSLPDDEKWNIVVDHKQAGREVLRTVQTDVRVPRYSMMVLYKNNH